MSIIITPDVLNYINNLINTKLHKFIDNICKENNLNIEPEIINKYINIHILYKKKPKTINIIPEEQQCLAINSSNKRCKKKKECNSKYCAKHSRKSNNSDYVDNVDINKISNTTSTYRISGEIIYINDTKYIFIKNNNLLFTYDLYNIQYIGKYIDGEIIYK